MKKWTFPNGSSIVFEDSSLHEKIHREWINRIGYGIGRSSKTMYGEGLGAQMELRDTDSPRGHVSIRKEVELQISHLEKQLAVQQELKKLLDENPVIEKFMNLSRGIL